mgnify:CR=1 FL=1
MGIGLGTAAIGRPLYINLKKDKNKTPFSLSDFKKSGLKILDNAYENGVRFFDTSPGYGMAEELLLEWLQKKNDASIIASTKWGYTYVANFDPNAKVHEIKEHSLQKLNERWSFSKKLLPYLKIYQVHSATLDSGILEDESIHKRLHQLKKENNLIIGLTTTGIHQIEVLKKALEIKVEGEKLFQSFQCTFNILDQSVFSFREELDNLKDSFIIKEALANGRLIPNENYPEYSNLYAFIKLLSEKYNIGEDAIPLRYCLEVFPSAKVLSGVTKSSHLLSNLKVNDFKLLPSEIEKLTDFGISAKEYWQERKELTWR